MLRSRLFEELVVEYWNKGLISGEMHLNVGEEAIIAGVMNQLIPGDAVATDHRSTAPFLMRNIAPISLLLEFIGHPEGLCAGMGGHMHLFSKENLMVSSGIVGASGPAAAGFALAHKYKKSKNIAVAFFGEGAMNQGMLLESMNLASILDLPVIFICKDNDWAITTRSHNVTGGTLMERAKGLGVNGKLINGLDVEEVWDCVNEVLPSMRGGKQKPYFIQAKCTHREGHFLGDPLLRFKDSPIKEFSDVTGPMMKSLLNPKGGRPDKRIGGMRGVLSLIKDARDQRKEKYDPIKIIENSLSHEKEKVSMIKNELQDEIQQIKAEIAFKVEESL